MPDPPKIPFIDLSTKTACSLGTAAVLSMIHKQIKRYNPSHLSPRLVLDLFVGRTMEGLELITVPQDVFTILCEESPQNISPKDILESFMGRKMDDMEFAFFPAIASAMLISQDMIFDTKTVLHLRYKGQLPFEKDASVWNMVYFKRSETIPWGPNKTATISAKIKSKPDIDTSEVLITMDKVLMDDKEVLKFLKETLALAKFKYYGLIDCRVVSR